VAGVYPQPSRADEKLHMHAQHAGSSRARARAAAQQGAVGKRTETWNATITPARIRRHGKATRAANSLAARDARARGANDQRQSHHFFSAKSFLKGRAREFERKAERPSA
jgi:hypothetical protein